jgi:hypothetical protein
MKTENRHDEYALFRAQLAGLDERDFDGHTCFKELTYEQRLDWLAELVVFVHECRLSRAKGSREKY